MSCYFQIDDNVLWNPSNEVARLFKGQIEVVASVLRLDSGLGDIIEDECEVAPDVFERFVAEAMKQYQHVLHPIFRSLTVGVIATASVLVERAGGQLPELDPEQSTAWTALRGQHARSMPR
jgi:hypothetical protein